MRALLLLPVAAAVQVLETHQATHAHVDYDGLKQTLKSISAKQAAGKKIDADSAATVRAILEQVDGVLMTALGEEAEKSQADLQARIDAIRSCDTERAAWFGTDADGFQRYENAAYAAGNDHGDCRGEENTACTDRNTKCDAQDGRVQAIDSEMCATPGFANGDTLEVNNFMNCMTKLVCDKYQAYVDGRTTCRTACADLSAKTAECHGKQGVFERATCTREAQVQNACKNYRDCRAREELAWYRTVKSEMELQQILQTQREALDCLQCYGRAILANKTSLEDCDQPRECCTLDGCPIVECPPGADCQVAPPLPFTQCNEPNHPVQPCDGTWLQNSYGDWNNGEISRQRCDPRVGSCETCDVENAEGPLTASGAALPAVHSFAPLCPAR